MTVAYDGTEFAGFQAQAGPRTVQETLEAALRQVTGEAVRIAGAGRTDAGVHASGQVISFSTASELDPRQIGRAFNALLPDDVAVRDAAVVPPEFHARFSARARGYRYTIWNGSTRSALARRTSYHWQSRLDVAPMDQAARMLVGQHDFAAFSGTLRGRDRPTRTVRTVHRLHCWRRGHWVFVDAVADGFLPQMVRNFVGTLLPIGAGQRGVEATRAVLAGAEPRHATTAPAFGLCLTKVWYD
jgi:tRNA pseudouridine38-40 synthase